MLTLDKIYHASYVLKDVVRKTDLIEAPNLLPEKSIYLKTENLQVTGSFKVRGSAYKISTLTDEEKERGVIACSAGNHAQGVALAATKHGTKSIISLLDCAPISKVDTTRNYGAEICMVKGVYDDAYQKAVELTKEHNYTFIHPFDDEDVIAGQGTIGLEILDQLPDVNAVVVPVGGGGLISGVAYAIKHLRPQCKVYGVQAGGAPSMAYSLQEHGIRSLTAVSTVADGIAVKTPGEHTFALCEEYVDEIVTVTDDEIATAILALMERQKLVTEGAGAVSVAAVMFGKIPVEGKVCCLLSGGNIDVTILNRGISRGLLKSGRSLDLTIELTDRPGELQEVSQIIAELGGNVVNVNHDRSDINMDINSCILKIRMETRDEAHKQQIIHALKEDGYNLL